MLYKFYKSICLAILAYLTPKIRIMKKPKNTNVFDNAIYLMNSFIYLSNATHYI